MIRANRETRKEMKSHFLYLVFLYSNIVITFAFLYMVLDLLNIGPIVDHYASDDHQQQWIDNITRAFYLSIITLFSVGYGDVTPFGISRAVAMVQAMLGFILPAVIVLKYMNNKG